MRAFLALAGGPLNSVHRLPLQPRAGEHRLSVHKDQHYPEGPGTGSGGTVPLS